MAIKEILSHGRRAKGLFARQRVILTSVRGFASGDEKVRYSYITNRIYVVIVNSLVLKEFVPLVFVRHH